MNEPMGRLGSCSPARARRTALEMATIASSWPIGLAQAVFHSEQLLALALQHRVDRDAGPPRDDGGDVLIAHFFIDHPFGFRVRRHRQRVWLRSGMTP